MLKVSPEIAKSVAFLGYKEGDTEKYVGTVFFIATEEADEEGRVLQNSVLWVTAAHVIVGLKSKDIEQVLVRFNLSDQTAAWFETNIEDWEIHQSDPVSDIALLRRPIPTWADHLAIGPDLFLSPQRQEKYQFGETDDVIVVGLYRHRVGKRARVKTQSAY